VIAAAFIEKLRARGLYLELDGPALVIEAEEGAARMTPEEREALKTLKPEVIAFLRGRTLGTDWTRVSLYQLDRVLEVSVPWSDVRLTIAPGCRLARELRARDQKPGRVWCTCEVLDLLLSGVTPEDARKVAQARLMFDGTSAMVAAPPGERHQ
jgi:hypothetical protein